MRSLLGLKVWGIYVWVGKNTTEYMTPQKQYVDNTYSYNKTNINWSCFKDSQHLSDKHSVYVRDGYK